MAPRKRVQSQAVAQALGGNVKNYSVAADAAHPTSKKRKRVSDRSDEAETSQADLARTKRPRRGRVGKLAGLMEMPMDILFEIFGHLMPLDVLRLARTTKPFRRILMHRSSLSIWIGARKNVPNLPDCPPYLSEPQFANLVFDTHCHECLSPNIRSVDWRIGRRICAKCAKGCMKEEPSFFVGDSVYKSVPSKYGKRGRPSYYSRDVEEFRSKVSSFTDPEERAKFVKERQALVAQMEKHGTLLDAWAANQAKDRSEQLDDLRRERKEAIIEKLTELGWGPEIEKILYSDDLSHHKLVKQPTRLTPRIWANIRDDMVSYMQQMKTRRLERERKALVISRKTTAVSVLRVYKISHLPITDIMPEPMDFCAFPEVVEILELPTETQVTKDTFAPVVEKMDDLIGEWRTRVLGSLVQRVKDSLYPHRVRTDRQGEIGSSKVDSTSRSSITDPMGKGKAKAVEPSVPDDARIIQDLSLATTVFNCRNCGARLGIPCGLYDSDFSSDTDYVSFEDDFADWFGLGSRMSHARSNPLFFPKVLGHHCLTKQHGFNWDSPSGDPTKQYAHPMGNRTRWNCHLLQVDEMAGKMAANVVRACGLDPEMATTGEMDDLDHQLACLECLDWSDDERDRAEASVFSWRGAVAHNCRVHSGRTNVKWKLIEEEDAADVINVDEEYRKSSAILSALSLQGLVDVPGSSGEAVWLCAECLDLPQETDSMELSRIKNHLSEVHSISEPRENQHYYKAYEAPQGRKPHIPQLKISLVMERPEYVRAPGESVWDAWHCADDFEDEVYDDYFF